MFLLKMQNMATARGKKFITSKVGENTFYCIFATWFRGQILANKLAVKLYFQDGDDILVNNKY